MLLLPTHPTFKHIFVNDRWDQYIMTDSEDEHEVNSNFTVSRLAECALIISLGSVCGLRGLEKVRIKGKGKVSLYLSHHIHLSMLLFSHRKALV